MVAVPVFERAEAEALGSRAMRKLQAQGVHHITLVGADRQTSIDFWEGLLGMPFVFEQPNLDNAKARWCTQPGSVGVRDGSRSRPSSVKTVISRPSPGSK